MKRARVRRRAGTVLALGLLAGALAAHAQPGSGVIRVTTTGVDGPACGAAATPCRNPQQAVNIATATDEIRLAAGTYTYAGAGLDTCNAFPNPEPAVVCVVNKSVTLRGGYSTANWNAPNAVANPTFLDGQAARRVIYALRSSQAQPPVVFELTDLTVRNGRKVGLDSSDDLQSFAFGAGLLVDDARAIVKRVVFSNNESVGGSTTHAGGHGGAGSGGGAAIRIAHPGTTFEDVTFDGNFARGGTGTARGGLALGGGLYTFKSPLTGTGLRFFGNSAIAGSTGGSGNDGSGFFADALGGGASFEIGSTVTLSRVLARGNTSIGGDASAASGDAGGGFGGALFAESSLPTFPTSMTLTGADLAGNLVLGGEARNGGLGAGGAIMAANTTVVIDRARIVDNSSQGGPSAGGGTGGAAGGGAGYFTSPQAGTDTVTIRNTIVADNVAALGSGAVSGGGGGGFFLQAIQGSFDHVTLARNELGSVNMQGQAMVLLANVLNSDIDFHFGAVAEHTVPVGPNAVHVQPGNTISFLDGAFSGNGANSGGGGTILNPGEMSSFADLQFLSPGAPDFDYRIATSSPLVDAATLSSEPRDVECQARPGLRDIGADETRPEDEVFTDDFESADLCAWAIL